MDNKKYLDFEGLKKYHDNLVEKLKDLAFDPQMMFDDKTSLVTLDNWNHDQYGKVFGLKKGLMVTVGTSIWQLEDPDKFKTKLTMIDMSTDDKAKLTETELGWKIVGSTTDFYVDEHTLNLRK